MDLQRLFKILFGAATVINVALAIAVLAICLGWWYEYTVLSFSLVFSLLGFFIINRDNPLVIMTTTVDSSIKRKLKDHLQKTAANKAAAQTEEDIKDELKV